MNKPSPGPNGSVESTIIKSYLFSTERTNFNPSSKNKLTLGSSNLLAV